MAFADPKPRVIEDSGQSVPHTAETKLRTAALRTVDGIGDGPTLTLKAAESCVKGDVLGYSSGWLRALATVGTAIQGRFVALEDGAAAATIRVSPCPVVSGYTGATEGNYVYVAEGTSDGEITETAPSTTNDANTIIGIVLTATTVQFCLNSRADSLSA